MRLRGLGERAHRRASSLAYPLLHLAVAPSYPSVAATTSAHLHPVFSHLGSGYRGRVVHVGNIHSLVLKHPSTSGTVVVGHLRIHGQPLQPICRGWINVAEGPHEPGSLSILLTRVQNILMLQIVVVGWLVYGA